ncbi:hypothetical protein ACHAWF_014115 [Thalassiosira exigua]
MQEAVPGSSAFEGFVATTRLTEKLTGHAERDRHLFRDALGDEIGKPIDELRGKALAGNHALKDDAASIAEYVPRDVETEWEDRSELLRRKATSINDGRS